MHISYENFLEESEIIVEGGNVEIDGVAADRIDLEKINRTQVIDLLDKSLSLINKEFEKHYGLPLWNSNLVQTKEYLSGSAFHFFDKAIPDREFRSHKPSVGDIDTMVDGNFAANLEDYLNTHKGQKLGAMTLVGFKKSAGQYISLWTIEELGINVQVDFELVDFSGGKPTPWSKFSHSSSWNDIQLKIKGVFHKYLLRALDARNLAEVIVLKGKKQTPKKIKATELAFSVQKGLRKKLSPVVDDEGKQRYEGGLPVYTEIATKDSEYITDLEVMYRTFFNEIPSSQELKQFDSFSGLVSLVKRNYQKSDWGKIVDGFVHTLFGAGAQGIYRGDPEKDYKEKMIALNYICKELAIDARQYDDNATQYYKSYK